MLEPVVGANDIVLGRRPVTDLGVTATDDATLVMHLATPTPYLLGLVAHPSTFPVHRPSLAANGSELSG